MSIFLGLPLVPSLARLARRFADAVLGPEETCNSIVGSLGDASCSGAAPARGGAPLVGASDGPPAHWLAYVAERAPHLVGGGGLVQEAVLGGDLRANSAKRARPASLPPPPPSAARAPGAPTSTEARRPRPPPAAIDEPAGRARGSAGSNPTGLDTPARARGDSAPPPPCEPARERRPTHAEAPMESAPSNASSRALPAGAPPPSPPAARATSSAPIAPIADAWPSLPSERAELPSAPAPPPLVETSAAEPAPSLERGPARAVASAPAPVVVPVPVPVPAPVARAAPRPQANEPNRSTIQSIYGDAAPHAWPAAEGRAEVRAPSSPPASRRPSLPGERGAFPELPAPLDVAPAPPIVLDLEVFGGRAARLEKEQRGDW